MTAGHLNTVQVDEAVAALRALVEHREDLVRARTQTINRLHTLLTQLIPGGAPAGLSAATAAALLRGGRPKTPLQQTLRRLATDLVTEIRRLDRRITAADQDIAAAVTAAGCTLSELYGIGTCWPARSLPESARHPLPLRRRVRLLQRHRTDRSVLRRRRPSPPVPRRGSATELLRAHHGHHPTPPEHPRPGLLPAQTRRRQESPRGPALPQTAAVRRGLPPACRRRWARRARKDTGGDDEPWIHRRSWVVAVDLLWWCLGGGRG